MHLPLLSRFARYVVAGGIGFLIEAVVLTWLVVEQGLNIYGGRVISFVLGVTATWLINRNFAFAGLQRRQKGREYSAYFIVQTAGAVINLGVFAAVITVHPALKATPVIPLAIGAIVSMVFNFLGARIWVFHGRQG